MPSFKLEQFGGMLPAWDDHLIPAGQAANSQNAYLFSGALAGWRVPKLLHTLSDPNATNVYRIPQTTQAVAGSTLTVLINPVSTDNVKLGEETYTFVDVLLNPYDVLIGADVNATAANLFAAFTVGNGQGTVYANGTCQNPAISQVAGDNTLVNNVIKVKAPSFGVAYNTTVTLDNTGGTRLHWTGTTFSGGTNQVLASGITAPSTWLEFADHDTDVLRTPVVDDKFNRFYFASPSLPPQYNTYDRIVAGKPHWRLGIDPPGCPPGVETSGGGDTATVGFSIQNSIASYFVNPNTIFLIPIKVEGAMSLTSISIMPTTTNGIVNWVGVAFEDNQGAPGIFVGQTELSTGTTAGQQATASFLNPPGLNNGQSYWIGFMSDVGIGVSVSDDTNHFGVEFLNTFTNGAPGVAPAVTTGRPDLMLTGTAVTASIIEPRAYIYTYVTEYGEESAPSPPTLVNGWNNGVWNVSLYTPPPDDMGVVRNITTIRVYRSLASSNGTATYFWVADYNIVGNSISDITKAKGLLPGTVIVLSPGVIQDTLSDDVVANNIQLPSTNWFPPPEELEGIVSLPNGIFAGFKGNEIWFCEPYRPHAWPPGYVITTAFPIVGIGPTMQALVVTTNSNPYVVNGVHPSAMALTKVELPEPNTSRGSIVSGDAGVFYTSPNGLIKITQDGQGSNYTQTWVTRERWQQLTPQKNCHAILLANAYFAFGIAADGDNSVAQQGFTLELTPADGQSFTIWPQPGGHRVGFNKMTSPTSTDLLNVIMDAYTGVGMLVTDGKVYYYDFTDPAPAITPYIWRSKLYQQTHKKNFEAMKVYFSVPPGTTAQNPTRKTDAFDDPSWNTLDADRYGYIKVFADGNLVTVREIRSDGELLRIASGFKAETWQWEFVGRVLISNMQTATSVKELSGV